MRNLAKKSVAAALSGELSGLPRRVLELRADGGPAAFTKLNTLLAGLDSDDRYRDWATYYGAATGRVSGRGFQPQNLPRGGAIEDVDAAILDVMSGDYKHIQAKYAQPLALIGSLLRTMICAPAGKKLLGADFTTIEPRILSLLADDQQKLDEFRTFDAGSGWDIYIATYARVFGVKPETVTKQQRAIAKIMVLALGYGGSLEAVKNVAPPDVQLTDSEILNIVARWRLAHPKITRLWRELDRAAWRAVRTPREVFRVGRHLAFECDSDRYLSLKLPSGRSIIYPDARLGADDYGRGHVVFKDNARGQWIDVRGYPGIWAENATSGLARDVLTDAMLRLDDAGFEIVLTVHDEIVVEVSENSACIEEFTKLMTTVPSWAPELPVAAKIWTDRRYTK